MASDYTTTRRVEFVDTDAAGIVHFTCFYRYMEQAEHEFFRSLGLSIMQKSDDGDVIGWPRVSASCNFEAPAYFEDLLEIRLRVDRKGVKSLVMKFEFWRGDTKIACGQLKAVCCSFRHGEKMKSIKMPPIYDEQIEEAPPEKS